MSDVPQTSADVPPPTTELKVTPPEAVQAITITVFPDRPGRPIHIETDPPIDQFTVLLILEHCASRLMSK